MTKQVFKKNIKSVVVFHRRSTQKIKQKIKDIRLFLKSKNIKCKVVSYSKKEKLNNSDLIVCLGGDGAFLKAVKYAKPILGINMGSLGFLTPHEAEQTLSLLQKTINGEMFLKKNHLLKTYLYQVDKNGAVKNKLAKNKLANNNLNKDIKQQDFVELLPCLKSLKQKASFYSVNDIVIERGAFSHLINVSIFINKEYIYSLKSDGLIIASPVGSTAYNLAAGGPILHPKVSSFVITPICSHSLTNRPVVISDNCEIYLSFKNTKAYLTIDGTTEKQLSGQNIVLIKKSGPAFLSVVQDKDSHFALLRTKLKFGQRN